MKQLIVALLVGAIVMSEVSTVPIKDASAVKPDTCTHWYDGCNTCKKVSGANSKQDDFKYIKPKSDSKEEKPVKKLIVAGSEPEEDYTPVVGASANEWKCTNRRCRKYWTGKCLDKAPVKVDTSKTAGADPSFCVKWCDKDSITHTIDWTSHKWTETKDKCDKPSACLENYKTKPESTCKTWFDGCNKCSKNTGGEWKCGKYKCSSYKTPSCIEKTDATAVDKTEAPKDCLVWFDGCNECKRALVTDKFKCTELVCITVVGKKKYCRQSVKKEDTEKDPVKKDDKKPPKPEDKKEETNKTPKEKCLDWFDGCNTCSRKKTTDEFGCTKRFCITK